MKNIYAYTEATLDAPIYPAYISIVRKDEGNVVIYVRSRGEGNASAIELSREQFNDFIENIASTKE